MKSTFYISALVLIRGDISGAAQRTFLWDEKSDSLREFVEYWELELAKKAIEDGFDMDEDELELSVSAVIPCPGDDMRGMPRGR